jgi:hypothetical protein
MAPHQRCPTALMRPHALGFTARRVRLRACVAIVGLWLSACGNASRTVAHDVLNRTIPPGDAVPSLSESVRAGQALQFTWDFESHLRPADYVDWLKTHLRDFQVVDGSDSNVHLGKLVGGDAYRLRVAIESEASVTRVHAQLTASPD